ncbi:MAG: dihydropteroate synthase [Pseudomonadota bacterium]
MLLAADNISGVNPAVGQAMEKLDPGPIQDLAKRCEAAGAEFIDINPGFLGARKLDRMAFLVEAVQEVTSKRIILDSPDAGVLSAGLSVCKDPPIINALTAEERKINEILPLAAAHSSGLVVLLLDDRSFAPFAMEEKIALALELSDAAVAAGLRLEDLIFDPLMPNISWHDAVPRVAECVKTVRLLSSGAVFQESVRTMIGLSNLRSGHRARVPFDMERTCFNALAGAGLSIVLADVLNREFMEAYRFVSQLV